MEIIPEFEYDPAKSRGNAEKYGIDFVASKALWQDNCAIEADIDGAPELRFLRTGTINGVFWTAICTWRGGSVRLISVRRARMRERTAYDAENDKR